MPKPIVKLFALLAFWEIGKGGSCSVEVTREDRVVVPLDDCLWSPI